MIKTEFISANGLKISVADKLQADDFSQIAPQVDSLVEQHELIRLMISHIILRLGKCYGIRKTRDVR